MAILLFSLADAAHKVRRNRSRRSLLFNCIFARCVEQVIRLAAFRNTIDLRDAYDRASQGMEYVPKVVKTIAKRREKLKELRAKIRALKLNKA